MVRWSQALASGKVVSAASYKLMTSPIKFSKSLPMTYGFALTADTMGTVSVVQHGGNINGFSSNLLTVPSESLYVAVNINVSGAPAGTIASDIARAITNQPRRPVATRDEPISATERAMFVGRYSMGMPNGTRREFTIGEDGQHITMLAAGAPAPLVLERYGRNVFAVQGRPAPRVVFEIDGDKASSIMLDQGVRPIIGYRVK
jgi:hypothetical protein